MMNTQAHFITSRKQLSIPVKMLWIVLVALTATATFLPQPVWANGLNGESLAVQGSANGCCLAQNGDLFVAPGTMVEVPDIVAERMGVDAFLPVESMSPLLSQRFDHFVNQVAPFLTQLVDSVIVLRHPEQLDLFDGAKVNQSILVGVAAPRKLNPSQPLALDNLQMTLYLFLPDELLSGEGLDYHVTGRNVIPYAKAPVPQTLGEMFDWVLAHEMWHFIDFQERMDRLCAHATDNCPQLEQLFINREPESVDSEQSVSQLLGWYAVGNAYSLGDEMEQSLRVTRGVTTYEHKRGALAVSYDDGQFAFVGGTVRNGYLPNELINLTDLRPLVQSGIFPTVYSLLEADHERFAEFGAWFVFNRMRGTGAAFQKIQPELHNYYLGKLNMLIR